MLQIKATPNYAGVEIIGDSEDFDRLHEAIHKVLGTEDEHRSLQRVRMRVLAFCYDIRHARMGNREFTYVDHGLSKEVREWMGAEGTDKSIYLSTKNYFPETIFILLVLEEFMELYRAKKAIHPTWDMEIATIRQFQASFFDAVRDILPPRTFSSMLKHMSGRLSTFGNFLTQYLDLLNIRFLNWDKEKRLKNISISAKRIAERGIEYKDNEQEILEAAEESGSDIDEIYYDEPYPEYEEIDW